ncbi:hypothetical protein OIU85_029056 [Salix viminalis]|uniref:Uncharacterized protein n=1 Tax=Salix viminalis TaxID=40686 RepID=A0A9Q0QAJ3_SALVM|nr:hypothetical protein OIU85_029056 [Salix viminalis]
MLQYARRAAVCRDSSIDEVPSRTVPSVTISLTVERVLVIHFSLPALAMPKLQVEHWVCISYSRMQGANDYEMKSRDFSDLAHSNRSTTWILVGSSPKQYQLAGWK